MDSGGGRKKGFYVFAPLQLVMLASTRRWLLLRQIDTFPISAKYEDGRPIPSADFRVTPDDVAMRWVTCASSAGEERDLYIVGTEQDVQAIHPIIYYYINGNPHNISLNEKAFNEFFDERR